MSTLDRNLHALATCYRVAAGLVGLCVSAVFLVMLAVNAMAGSLSIASLVLGILPLGLGGVVVYQLIEVATSLEHHRRRTFCLVAAWITCAFPPLGTVLGVFTILQLIQPEAERVFAEAEARAAAPPENEGPQPSGPLNLNHPQPGASGQ